MSDDDGAVTVDGEAVRRGLVRARVFEVRADLIDVVGLDRLRIRGTLLNAEDEACGSVDLRTVGGHYRAISNARGPLVEHPGPRGLSLNRRHRGQGREILPPEEPVRTESPPGVEVAAEASQEREDLRGPEGSVWAGQLLIGREAADPTLARGRGLDPQRSQQLGGLRGPGELRPRGRIGHADVLLDGHVGRAVGVLGVEDEKVGVLVEYIRVLSDEPPRDLVGHGAAIAVSADDDGVGDGLSVFVGHLPHKGFGDDESEVGDGRRSDAVVGVGLHRNAPLRGG